MIRAGSMASRRFSRLLISAVTLCSLLACGGGGGKDTPGGTDGNNAEPSAIGSGDFSVTLDRNEVAFSYQEGEVSGSAIVNAIAHGTIPKTLYVGAVVEGTGISKSIPAYFTASGAQFHISPDNLPAGTYKGRLLLYACADQACTQPIGGTPLPVITTVEVVPTLKVTPQVTINAVSGHASTASATVMQLPANISTFTASVTRGGEWLTIGPADGNNLPITAKSVRSGTYFGTITVVAGQQTKDIPVSYVVKPPESGEHDLLVSTNAMTYAALENMLPPAQTVNVDVPTWSVDRQDLHYAIEYGDVTRDWLTVQTNDRGLTVTAAANELTKGSYTAKLRVTHADSSVVQTVSIALSVGSNLIRPADQSMTVTTLTNRAAMSNTIGINLASGTPVTWLATSNAPWLKIMRANGHTGGSLSYAIDPILFDAASNDGDLQGQITVTPTGVTMTPVTFNVSVHKALTELHYAGPYLLLSGQPAKVRLRGKGFNSVPDVLPYLDLGGITPDSVTRINDEQALMQVPALSAGTYLLKMKNELGASTHTVRLKVVDPVQYNYAAIPTGGDPSSVFYDAARKAIFTSKLNGQRLTQYTFANGQWTEQAAYVPGLVDFGMAPDGDALLTVSTSRALQLWHADTLENLFTLDQPRVFSTANMADSGYPATNNGRTWFTPWGLFYFDHWSRTLVDFAPSNRLTGIASLSVDGDGERLLIDQGTIKTASGQAPPVLYMDASDGSVKVNAVSELSVGRVMISANGKRVLMARSEVRDAEFKLIGRLASRGMIDSIYNPVDAVISPDGNRVYVLTRPFFGYEPSPAHDAVLPRVFVFDSSRVNPGIGLDLPIVATFDLPDDPATCKLDTYGCTDSYVTRMTISPDGLTLFIAGAKNLIVAPVNMAPPTVTSTLSSGRMQAMSIGTQAAKPAFQPWLFPKH